ncbi:DUF1801 domain-containing protein [Flagellimonas beolgyonensis]|uniref:DUF1801 domain-containing protein n=1 Tax=Flagellimonas beolgyonensis TaxID=864064 RepID=UPI003D645D50
MSNLNNEVTEFLDGLNHPLRNEIEILRHIVLNATTGLTENIKWNGPNYRFQNEDRITMKIQPPKTVQLIFHRGATKQIQPENKLLDGWDSILTWKENDRAIATFNDLLDIERTKTALTQIVNNWIKATKL